MRRLVLSIIPFLLLPAVAAASDSWTNPHPGIWHLNRTTSTPWQIDVLHVDLCRDGVGLRATRSEERQSRTSNWAGDAGVHAAVNGDFFSYSNYGTVGMAVGEGAAWPSTGDSGGHGFVAFGWDRAELSPPPEVRSVEGWMREVVGGNVHLVAGGVPMSSDSGSFCTTRHPRTAAGFSEDGRTLILAVVDGRTSSSAGMRCSELASLMSEMGAHEALNLDGGGSTTMYVAGDGVVNNPSDGSERVVANHLGVFATGLLERPDSCDRALDGAAFLSGAWTGSTSTDVDGDGLADLCGRHPEGGWQCFLAPDWTPVESPGLEDESGWWDPSNASTLRMGDVTGDGRADLCARADAGVVCWPSEGAAFGPLISGPAWSDAAGWDAPKYYGTLHLADVDGDERDDVCGRTADGFQCHLSDGAGFPTSIAMDDLADGVGWGHPRYYGTIRMGDLDGDGRADVCGRAALGLRCWLSTGTGFGAVWAGPDWSDEAGWDDHSWWSSIRLIDLDGDGLTDACGRGGAGIECSLSTGTGFGPVIVGPEWSDAGGWGDWSNAATLRFGDLDGDGDQDLCARANAGVLCAPFDGAGFGDPFWGPALDDAGAWDLQRFHSTMRLADVDGDGRADLCARGWSGMRCWASLGAGFVEESEDGPAWGEPTWSSPDAYGTVRLVSPPPIPPEPGDDDDDDDVTPSDDDDSAPSSDDDDVTDDDDDGSDLSPPELSPVPPGLGCDGCSGGDATFAWLLLLLPGLSLPVRRSRRGRASTRG